MSSLLEIDDLRLTYPGSGFSLGPINFSMGKGSCIGIMGENGAGKTSLFQLVTGNLSAQSGRIRIGNETMAVNKPKLKRKIGYLPQNLELPRWVSGREILLYSIKLLALENPRELCQRTLEFWDCTEFANKPLAACSHGMKKRVALGLATLHEPELLILDEPFSGLDLFHIQALQMMIEKRKASGRSSLICTHIAPYTAKLCDDLVTLRQGSLSILEGWKGQDYLGRIQRIEDLFFPKGEC